MLFYPRCYWGRFGMPGVAGAVYAAALLFSGFSTGQVAAQTPVHYPLIVTVWDDGPFDMENINRPDLPSFISDEELEAQLKIAGDLRDKRLLVSMAVDWALSHNPKALAALEELLRSEGKDTNIAAAALKSASLVMESGVAGRISPDLLRGYFASPDALARGLAIKVFAMGGGAPEEVLELLAKEKSEYVVALVWPSVEKHARGLEGSLIKLAESGNPAARQSAIELLAASVPNPDSLALLAKTAGGDVVVDRLAIARGISARKDGGEQILRIMATDSWGGVRSMAAAAATSPERLDLFIGLTADSDSNVRSNALRSLAAYDSDKAVEPLLAGAKDGYVVVRSAAEAALVEIGGRGALPDLNGRVAALLEDANGVDVAINYLAALDVRHSAADIEKILKKAGSVETLERGTRALAVLEFRDGWRTLAELGGHAAPRVRTAVADSLAVLAVPDSFSAIAKLIADPAEMVSLRAIRAAGVLRSPVFSAALTEIIDKVGEGAFPNRRSYACWSLAAIGQPDAKALEAMRKLCLNQVVRVEGQTMYDSDYVRAAAAMALGAIGKTDGKAAAIAEDVVNKLKSPPVFDPTFNNPTLREYGRQIDLWRNGETAEPLAVPNASPNLTARRVRERGPDYRTHTPGLPGR